MSSYPIPCYADMQRAVPADSGAGTGLYWAMPSNTAIWNFSIFRDRAQEELIYFPIPVAMFSMMFHRLMWTFSLLHSCYSFFISAYLSIKNRFFRTLLTLDNYIYQMRKQNIMKFCLFIPKHLIIQIAKLHIDILNLNTTFRHCKNSDYFWTRVYTIAIPPSPKLKLVGVGLLSMLSGMYPRTPKTGEPYPQENSWRVNIDTQNAALRHVRRICHGRTFCDTCATGCIIALFAFVHITPMT